VKEMKNYTKKRNKFTAILIMTLFLGSMFYFNLENPLTDLSEEKQINEQIAELPPVDQDVSTWKQSPIDYDTFYTGESVKTDIEFNKQGVDYELLNWYSTHQTSSYGIRQFYFENYYVDDGNVWTSYLQWGSAVSATVTFGFIHRLYCGGEGDIYYDFRGEWFSGALNSYMTNWVSGTKAVDSSDLDSQGYLNIEFYVTAIPLSDKVMVYIYMHTTSGREVIGFVQKTGCTDPSIATLSMNVDYFYFLRDTITNNVRSTYKYNSPTTITHKVKPPSVTFAKEMNIYYDETRWTYSSITPTASVTDSSGVLTINSPTELDYKVLFTSSCSNHLAIKDVSTSFLTDVGFEGGTCDDLTYVNFDSFSVDTAIVSEGYYSCKGVDTDSTDDTFSFNFDYRGGVYLNFDYYLLSGYTWTELRVYWRISDSAWDYETFSFGSAERWNSEFVYFELKGIEATNNRNVAIHFENGQGTAYLDDVKILTSSTTIKTTQSSEYSIKSSLMSWDGYKNPLLIGQQILNTTILERSSQTVEYTTNLTSTTGIFELNYNQALEQKEYEIWTYSYSSGEFNNCSFYFTPSYPTETDFAEIKLLDAWDFSEGDFDGWVIGSAVYDMVATEGYLQFETHLSGYGRLEYENTLFDSSFYDSCVLRISVNDTTDSPYVLFGKSTPTLEYSDRLYLTSTNTFLLLTDEVLGWNGETGTEFRLYFDSDAGTFTTNLLWKIDFIRYAHIEPPELIETDTSFYLTSTDNDYSYEIYLDENYLGVYTDLETILKNNTVGTHNLTYVLFSDRTEKAYLSSTSSYYYSVAADSFTIYIHNSYPSDDYFNLYCTSNYDYSYTAYTNNSVTGTGNGLSEGTFIIVPKEKSAGIFNLTLAFVNGSDTVLFMTWYSNLIPPPEPNTNIFREQSEGYYNISFITNLDYFWIDIYHDNVLIYDDSTSTDFNILKNTLIGWHNVSMILIYNCSTDAEGYPVAEYNVTVNYPLFWYETVLFYNCKIRYTEKIYGIAVPEIEVDDVLTYLDGELVDTLNYTSVIQDHSNYSYILNNRLWIHNSARNHSLVVRDLFGNLIYNTTIDIGIIYSMTIELPLEKLYVINLDDTDRMVKIRPYLSGLDWDTDADDLITMILGQYESKSYWMIDATYESRIYKKVEAVQDGVTVWYWVQDPDVTPPPDRVPFSIEIPLTSDDDDDGEKTWWDKIVNFFVQYWFYIVIAIVLIALIIAFNAVGNAIVKKQEEQLKQHKKTSLMAETVLQLLYAGKYERLKGFEKRGKEK
jgi:hypothetical protein